MVFDDNIWWKGGSNGGRVMSLVWRRKLKVVGSVW